jgi:protein required for attachment to host cells
MESAMGTIRVVVADSSRADLYDLPEPRATLVKAGTIGNAAAGKHERDFGKGPPGRMQSSAGGSRTALQPRHTRKEHATDLFARQLARAVAASARAPGVDGVVLVAAPRFLAAIKAHLSKTAQSRVIAELRRDLVDVPKLELRARVHKVVPLPRPR